MDGLELRNLGCTRGGRRLFAGLNCRVPPGQALRVHGANGAGKTSLLRTLCGLLPPTRGEVFWRGEAVGPAHEGLRSELVYVGHAAGLKDELSPLENLMSAARLAGRQASPAAAASALEQAGLAGRIGVPVGLLSQGQRRRCSLARLALANDTPLWILDEPFAALDTSALQWVETLLQAHVRRAGIVVLTCHLYPGLPGIPEQVLEL